RIPLQNLELVGAPSVNSQFTWINGTTTKRKIFRFIARPKASGGALVGPLVVNGADGQRETLPPVTVQVLPDAAAGTNDPLAIFRELVATRRDPIFVVAEVDKTSAYAGEEVVATWRIYNAATVREWQLVDLPKLEDFWSEELDVRNEPQEQVALDESVVQKVVVRRVALFPLRSGTLRIAPIGVEALVLRRTDSPFGFFEGSTFDVTRRSAPIAIDVKPLPPGPPVDAVGDLTLTCSKPVQRNGGPVVMHVTLQGRANLRAAVPPHWERALDGSVQIGEQPMSVQRTHDYAEMTRRWTYLLFPAHGGRFEVPALESTTFTSAGARQTLRCEASTLDVTAAAPPVEPPPATPAAARVRTLRPYLPWIGGALLLFIIVMLSIPRLRRAADLRRRVRSLARGKTPQEVREAVEAMLVARGVLPSALLTEASERGDAFRALRSLIDAADRLDVTPREIEDRVRDLLQSLA
ncbi:MAG TPA: BatD family protein, partial [Thermoanaerobaculia bacterium]|nr:BatD family protein [Thermoanaerobaculia bacterium]